MWHDYILHFIWTFGPTAVHLTQERNLHFWATQAVLLQTHSELRWTVKNASNVVKSISRMVTRKSSPSVTRKTFHVFKHRAAATFSKDFSSNVLIEGWGWGEWTKLWASWITSCDVAQRTDEWAVVCAKRSCNLWTLQSSWISETSSVKSC